MFGHTYVGKVLSSCILVAKVICFYSSSNYDDRFFCSSGEGGTRLSIISVLASIFLFSGLCIFVLRGDRSFIFSLCGDRIFIFMLHGDRSRFLNIFLLCGWFLCIFLLCEDGAVSHRRRRSRSRRGGRL